MEKRLLGGLLDLKFNVLLKVVYNASTASVAGEDCSQFTEQLVPAGEYFGTCRWCPRVNKIGVGEFEFERYLGFCDTIISRYYSSIINSPQSPVKAIYTSRDTVLVERASVSKCFKVFIEGS